jgi:hypothetical protein
VRRPAANRAPAGGGGHGRDGCGEGVGGDADGVEDVEDVEGVEGVEGVEAVEAVESQEVSSNVGPPSAGVCTPSPPNPSHDRRRRGDGIGVRRGGVRPGGEVRRKIRPA